MEQEHRNRIRNNIERLIQNTEYEELMKACFQNQLLTEPMRDTIELSPNPSERHRLLIEKITHRGPDAYNKFEKILKERFPDAAETLTNTTQDVSIRSRLHRAQSNNGNPIDTKNISLPPLPQTQSCIQSSSSSQPNTSKAESSNNPIELKEYTDDVRPMLNFRVEYSKKIHGLDPDSKVGVYPMNSKNRGIFVLVNNINFKSTRVRNGAHADRDNLIHLFREMMFKVFYYEDLFKDDFVRLIRNLSQWNELKKFDCFVLAVLSHGDGNEFTSSVEFLDHETFETADILTQFNNVHCKYLVGKPKIFLFPFCRGRLTDPGVLRTQQTESDSARDREPTVETNIPTFSDMKICYATLPGYNAFRHPVDGSWYVQILCRIFAQHAHDNHFEDLLKLIGEAVNLMRTEHSQLQTTSNEDRGFTKRLYFNPGFPAD